METIQMLDLSGQYQKIREETDAAIRRVIDSSLFINGSEVTDFAVELAAFTGAGYAIPCGNGTDALQIALMALALKPGDEVIVPSFAYIAAVEAVALLGLRPVFVDVDRDTFNIDANRMRQAVSGRTKAVIPVHLFGQSADMEAVSAIAAEYGLSVIEDNAQSIGAEYTFHDGCRKQAGTIGTVGCLSFFPSKNLGCFGDGGALLTNDGNLAARVKQIASHGQATKYRHETIGINSRLDTIQAAVLRVKLRHLDSYNRARIKAANYYREHLSEMGEFLQLPVEQPFSTHVYNQFTIQVKHGKRDELKSFLADFKIPSMVYYPLSLPDQPVFSGTHASVCGVSDTVSRQLSRSVLSLPMHTELSEEQLSYIVKYIKTFFYEQ